MSSLVTQLREGGRDGIDWPPVGTWKQNESINRLETFADNLAVSRTPENTDLLNSVPTPWARLLLFENALYRETHPSHVDIEDQWRGLLGVIALAAPLRLALTVESIALRRQVDEYRSEVAKSFIDLKPVQQSINGDEETGKWDDFQMISVDGVVIGSTSPRTLLFTGVAHHCPPSIPFRSPQGRLSDPVGYYKRFNDRFYLSLMARWISSLISSLERNQPLRAWMGSPPLAPGAQNVGRLELLVQRLKVWMADLAGVEPANIPGNYPARFTLFPYTIVQSLPEVPQPFQSDLLIGGRPARDSLVAYHSEGGSKLLNSFGQELVNEPIRVANGRWITANQPVPLPMSFLPNGIKAIEDPTVFFEDTLIQVAPPRKPGGVYHLVRGENRYLYPFRPEILNFFSPQEINERTEIFPNLQLNTLRVEFKIPVENNRTISVTRDYALDTIIPEADTNTAELSSWPDFTCPGWRHHYYFKNTSTATVDSRLLDFEPIGSATMRTRHNHTWYLSSEPLQAFQGSVGGKSGLLLLRQNRIKTPNKLWKVGVDFGSTHTRAFFLEVEQADEATQNGSIRTVNGATTQPIQFFARARELTYCQEDIFKEVFLALDDENQDRSMTELKTLLMLPEPNGIAQDGWLPSDGFVYRHWIFDGKYNADGLRFNLKWNSYRNDHDLRAFLRCLLVMLQAEAFNRGARVVSLAHTYPSVFTSALVAKHNGEWHDLELYFNGNGAGANSHKLFVEPATMTETVAVCRHLEKDQDASPVSNTISIDVGGSTSDMAVWAENQLKLQESVKLAAGILGRYLQSPEATGFITWFETIMHSAPHHLSSLRAANFSSTPSGFSLMFTNVLSFTELRNQLQDLMDKSNGAPEARRFMSHIIYLFAGLVYYAGLMARKAGLPQHHTTYNIYFCGKGGTLLQWILGHDVLVQQMFEAGLFGPAGSSGQQSPTVITRMSKRPKEEVGRGLLVESELQGSATGPRLGLVDPNTPSVTVGEVGYGTLKWNDKLTQAALEQLPVNTVPPLQNLKELNTFLDAFRKGDATKAAAIELKLDTFSADVFRNNLLKRLFGNAKGCIISDVRKNDHDALIEPLFITEIKVLLETATQNIRMYD
jgi:hypothetical protein